MTVKELRQLLKNTGVKGIWRMRKAELENAWNEYRGEYIVKIDEITEEARDQQAVKKALKGKKLLNFKGHADWLELRMSGIGGSDIASIIGHNKYSSAIDVYMTKVAKFNIGIKEEVEKKQKAIAEKDSVKMGHILEPVVAELFANDYRTKDKYKVVDYQYTVKAEEHELANVDRYLIDKKTGKVGILEIKTTSYFNRNDWEGEEVPMNYWCQVQWYLHVTGLDYAYIACLVAGQTYRPFYIERDEEAINFLAIKAQEFWYDNVLEQNPPHPDDSSAYTEHLKAVAERIEANGEKIEIEGIEEEDRYDEILEEIEALKKEKTLIENKIMNQALERGSFKGTWGEHKFSISKPSVSLRFDSKKFKEEHGDLYMQYMKESKRKASLRIS